jgi:mRNA interferase RelE/StbE
LTPIWRVEFTDEAERDLRELAPLDRNLILKFLQERIERDDDPRRIGEALKGPRRGLWRYRVGDFRVLAEIVDRRVTVVVIEIGNRREIYR